MPLHADGAQRPVERWFKSSSGRGGRQFGSTGGDASLASRLVDQKVTTRDFPIRSIYRLTAQKPANHVEGEIGVWNTDSDTQTHRPSGHAASFIFSIRKEFRR